MRGWLKALLAVVVLGVLLVVPEIMSQSLHCRDVLDAIRILITGDRYGQETAGSHQETQGEKQSHGAFEC